MKLTVIIFLGLILIPFVHGQSDEVALDTIIKVEGKIMPVEVTKVTSSYVKFKVPGNDKSFTMARKDIHKIIFKNGRIEEYNDLVLNMISEDSWKAVWLTDDEKDVLSLYKRGKISAEAPPSYRSSSAAKKNATIRIQKKAASMQGEIVLVTKRQTVGGYGEPQGYIIEGIVYGSEPLTEEETEGDIL